MDKKKSDIEYEIIDEEYFTESGNFEYREKYLVNGVIHRVEGPAITRWDEDGDLIEESWYLNGRKHRVGGPAVIKYRNLKIDRVEYYIDGQLHRLNGPAEVHFFQFARGLRFDHYYLNGVSYEKKEYRILRKYLILIQNGIINIDLLFDLKRRKRIKIIDLLFDSKRRKRIKILKRLNPGISKSDLLYEDELLLKHIRDSQTKASWQRLVDALCGVIESAPSDTTVGEIMDPILNKLLKIK